MLREDAYLILLLQYVHVYQKELALMEISHILSQDALFQKVVVAENVVQDFFAKKRKIQKNFLKSL